MKCSRCLRELEELAFPKTGHICKDCHAEYQKIYREKYRHVLYKRKNDYRKLYYDNREDVRLAKKLRQGTRYAILSQSTKSKYQPYLGCTGKQAYQYLVKLGYTEEHEVDHIIPLSFFNLKSERHKKYAMHFRNLQPLTPEENNKKKNQLPENYQELIQQIGKIRGLVPINLF